MLRLQGRSRESCEQHWKTLYSFAFNDDKCIIDAINAYYETSDADGWNRQETVQLFFDRNFLRFTERSEERCTVHYYAVLGMNFKRWGTSIDEGIHAVAEAYHEKQATKPDAVKVKQD